jgi:hypothetical protein
MPRYLVGESVPSDIPLRVWLEPSGDAVHLKADHGGRLNVLAILTRDGRLQLPYLTDSFAKGAGLDCDKDGSLTVRRG